FDNISYQKGCAVLRMLENFIGEDAFRTGLRAYMQEFAEANATKEDLWRHLSQASGEPVEDVMASWINQGGYPVIRVSLESNTLKLSQKRFFSSPDARGHGQMWHVPIVLRYEDAAGIRQRRVLLDSLEMAVPLDIEGDLKWLYANAEEIGFYRQHLDSTVMPGLLANLDKLSPLEQTGLVSDQWALTRNGTQGISGFLEVLSALTSTTHYNVLEAVVGRLHAIEDLLEDLDDTAALRKFRAWVGDRFRAQMEEVGYEPRHADDQNDTQRRVALVDAMSTIAEDEEAVRQATHYASREAEDPASVDPNLAGLYVLSAARTGDRARFDRYVDIYKARKESGSSPQETNRYLYSLAQFRQPETIDAIYALMADGVIPQEAVGRVLRQQFGLAHAKVAAWHYIKANWPTIRNLGDMWTGFLVELTGRLPSNLRGDIVAFFDANLQGVAEKPYARALETLDQLAEFKQRIGADLIAWFKH
ncbi:MAG: ERAP1-like C-terminal domain-containing protein, partial [Chloroflexia bacterium]